MNSPENTEILSNVYKAYREDTTAIQCSVYRELFQAHCAIRQQLTKGLNSEFTFEAA